MGNQSKEIRTSLRRAHQEQFSVVHWLRCAALLRDLQPHGIESDALWATMTLAFENRRLAEAEYLQLCGFDGEDL